MLYKALNSMYNYHYYNIGCLAKTDFHVDGL